MIVSIDIPEEAGIDEHFIKEAVAATLYHTGKLSERQAREMLGMTRRAFEEMLPHYGYSIGDIRSRRTGRYIACT